MCPSRMPTEVTTVTRIEGQDGGGRGGEREEMTAGWTLLMNGVRGASRLPICRLSRALPLSFSLSRCSISVSSFSLFTVKWRNHRDVERLRRHDVNYRPVPRARARVDKQQDRLDNRR